MFCLFSSFTASIFPFRSLIYLEYIFVYGVMKYSNFILIFLLERTCTLSSTVSWKSLSRVQLFATLWIIQSMEFSRQNTRVCSLSLLQGIVPTQGLNPGLSHCRRILYRVIRLSPPQWLFPTSIPGISVGGFPFLLPFSNIYCLYQWPFWPMWSDTLLQSWVAFL